MIEEIPAGAKRWTVTVVSWLLALGVAVLPFFDINGEALVAFGGVSLSWLTYWLGYMIGFRKGKSSSQN